MDKQLSARQRRPSMARRKKRRIGAFSRRLSLSDLDLRQVRQFDQERSRSIGDPTFQRAHSATAPGCVQISKYILVDIYAKAVQGMAAADAVRWAPTESW
jgi:hypothetical protein